VPEDVERGPAGPQLGVDLDAAHDLVGETVVRCRWDCPTFAIVLHGIVRGSKRVVRGVDYDSLGHLAEAGVELITLISRS
jgi:hypothetical protein